MISFSIMFKPKYFKQLAIAVCSVFICASKETYAVPVLWGVDEDTGRLLKIESYNSSPTVTDYGLLSLNDGGTIRALYDTNTSNSAEFSDIEAFTISPMKRQQLKWPRILLEFWLGRCLKQYPVVV